MLRLIIKHRPDCPYRAQNASVILASQMLLVLSILFKLINLREFLWRKKNRWRFSTDYFSILLHARYVDGPLYTQMLYWWVGRWRYQVSLITKKDWQHLYTDTERSRPHITASLLLQTLSLKAFPPFLDCFFSSHTLPNQASSWGKLLRGPHISMASLCSLCTRCINAGPQRPPRGHPRRQVCGLQLSKGMCWLSTLNYNLTWSENKNTVMCIFFPRNDNYSTPNFNYQNGKGITKNNLLNGHLYSR